MEVGVDIMKIALTCPASLPATQFGGILFLGIDIARELAKKGNDVTIYTTDLDFAEDIKHFNKKLPRNEKVDGFTIKRTHVFFKIKLFFVNPGIYNQIKKDNPDIIHAIGVKGFQAFVSVLLSKIYHKPLIISDQGGLDTHPDYESGSGKFLYKIQEPLIKFILKQAKKVIAANEYERSLFLKYCDSSKIVIIENGINFENLQNIPFEFKTKNKINGRFILFLGRFNRVKGVDVLIEAFIEICRDKNFDDVILVIMGADFGYRDQMMKKINESRLEHRIMIFEKPPRESVISAYHACEFLVLPSRWEMSPLTPLEGFACKKPSVSCNVFGIPNVIKNGKNGILVKPENPSELADAIRIMLNDSEKVFRFGQDGFDYVKNNCTSKIMAEKVLDVYNSVLK